MTILVTYFKTNISQYEHFWTKFLMELALTVFICIFISLYMQDSKEFIMIHVIFKKIFFNKSDINLTQWEPATSYLDAYSTSAPANSTTTIML